MAEQKVKLTDLPAATDTIDSAQLLINQNSTDQKLPVTHFLRAKNNLSELTNFAQARANLDVPSVDEVNEKLAGFIDGSYTFSAGGSLASRADFIWDEESKSWYYWTGNLPKEVPAASNPSSTGGVTSGAWESVGTAFLRSLLAGTAGESLVGGATYTQIRASNVTGNQIKCLGRSANRDGGEGWFFLDVADTTSADDDGTVLVDSVGRRWKRAYEGSKKAAWWGVKDGADISAALQSAVNTGGRIEVQDGQYTVSSPITVDFTSATFPVLGRKSARYDLTGESQHNTTFNTNNNDCIIYTGNDYVDPAKVGQGIFSGMRWANFCIYGTNNTGVAIRLNSAIGVTVRDVQIRRNNYGLFLRGILTSNFDNLYLDYNNTGMYVETGKNSSLNNVTYTNCKYNSNNRYGVIGEHGIRVSYRGCSWESCGWGTNDAGGDDNTGAVYIRAVTPFSTIEFDGCYFEANEGLADITISNATASPITVNIRSTTFTRGNIRGKGSKYVLNFLSPGGGPIILNQSGNTFITNTGTGFVTNPAWVSKSFLIEYGRSTCTFSNPESLPASSTSAAQSTPVSVLASGAIAAGPAYMQCTKTSTGVYQFTSTYSLGADVNAFAVLTSPRTTGFRVDVTKNSNINLTIRVRDSAGVLADGAFDLAIITGRGEGR